MDSTNDRIEKKVTLKAPVSRVWQAIADAREFGRWFGVKLDGPFVAGKTVTGTFGEGLDEAAIIEHQKSLGLRGPCSPSWNPASIACRRTGASAPSA